MKVDYSSFYRRSIKTDRIASELSRFDVFVSAYNDSERVRTVFSEVKASKKIWHIHPEYQYTEIEEPLHPFKSRPAQLSERHQMDGLLAVVGDLKGKSLCVDITGFMRHMLAFMIGKLASLGVSSFTALYSEPDAYVKQENTQFSTTTTGVVRPILGMSGSNNSSGKDHLIVMVGYDHKLVAQVTDHKDNADVLPIFAFPSLSPDMYQQSAVRTSDSGGIALEGSWITNRRFAPANDPFSTAQIISDAIKDIDRTSTAANIYLAPLSTKVQTLGAALYWQLEGRLRGATSILYPECSTYTQETSVGLKRLWSFTVEF